MSQNLEKLKRLLDEVFQLDQAELDFGIYRIMNAKREEITRFLDRDLLPQVREAFQSYEAESRGAVEAELADAIEKAKELGVDPAQTPLVKELQARYNLSAEQPIAEENGELVIRFEFKPDPERRVYDAFDDWLTRVRQNQNKNLQNHYSYVCVVAERCRPKNFDVKCINHDF